MPYCQVGRCKANTLISNGVPPSAHDGSEAKTQLLREDEESVSIFYQRYGHGPTKVLLIIGLAGTLESWGPQIMGLCGTDKPREAEDAAASGNRGGDDKCVESAADGHGANSVGGGADINSSELDYSRLQTGNGVEVCTFDNRGVGKSSIPMLKTDYTTKTMAEDALALLDHLGWDKAHVCGHSMGGMIACKLAAMAPHRLSSLTLIGVTGGGYQCLPKFNRKSFSLAYRLYCAKTPEERSAVDLETHYTHEYLESTVGESNRRALLFKEYVNNLLNGGMQPRFGLEGQASACWNHSLSTPELETIRSAGVIVAVIHGRGDVIAQVEHARKLAKKLSPVSRMIELSGGHLVTHQNVDEVNGVLLGVIRAVKMNVQCTDFKASDVGMYDTQDFDVFDEDLAKLYPEEFPEKHTKPPPFPGGDHWQTGGTSGEGGTQDQRAAEAESQASAAGSVLSMFWRKVLPDWMELVHIFPFLHWISRLFGIDKLRDKVSVF